MKHLLRFERWAAQRPLVAFYLGLLALFVLTFIVAPLLLVR